MKIIQKIRDFFAKRAWKWLWLEHCSRRYREVDASTLEKICECINPSYSRVIELAREQRERDYTQIGKAGQGDMFDDPHLADAFYDDRKEFLDRIYIRSFKEEIPNSFHEYLTENFSSVKEEEKFRSEVAAWDLQEHILLSDEDGGKALKFVNLRVKGDVNLNLSGKFNRWEFNRVKFGGGIGISVFPPLKRWHIGEMVFNKIICRGSFVCLYAGVPSIRICDSDLPVVSMQIREHAPMPVCERMKDMVDSYFRTSLTPIVEFSGNCIKELYPYTDLTPIYTVGDPHKIKTDLNLGSVHFVKGNYIGNLHLLTSMLPYDESMRDDSKVRTFFPGDKVVSIRHIHFDSHEHIGMPSGWEEKMKHKEYFVALKNQAIRKRDREAEFSYGRKERYFDRGLANRWQDKFILEWSHYVSDSGISWIRPAAILLVGQLFLATIFIGGFGGCGGWFIAAVESLNPLSSLPNLLKLLGCESWNDSLSASIYNAVRRIFSLALLYEIIKVLRRFSK